MSGWRGRAAPFLRGIWIVARREAWSNTRSLRLAGVTGILALAVLAAAFGLSGLTSAQLTVYDNNLLWVHPAYPSGNASDRAASVFVSDSFGHPRAGVVVEIGQLDPVTQERSVVDTTATDAAGGALFRGLTLTYYSVWLEVGATEIPGAVAFQGPPQNLSVAFQQTDLARAGYRGDLFFHATDARGDRLEGAALTVNGTSVASTDANGFVHAHLEPGRYTVNVTVGGDRQVFAVSVAKGTAAVIPALSGPNSLLAFLALGIVGFLVPIFAIAISYDAIAKERFNGSMDLLLIRPVSRAGVAVGKFLGTWTAVAIPTAVVALGGAVAVSLTSGRAADAGFVAAFLLATLFLIAAWVLIMQVLSTLMRTPGTAVLAALLAWFTFEFLWSVVFLIVTAALGIPGGSEAYYVGQNVTNLTNPGGVFAILIGAALPADVTFGQGSAYGLPAWAGPLAAAVWIAALLPIAVWTFVKRAPR